MGRCELGGLGFSWHWLIDFSMKYVGDAADFVRERREFAGDDGLHAVGERFFGLVVNFDEETVGADGDCGERQGKYFVALAGAVGRIDHDRQMAAALDGRHDGEIQRVARKIGESSDAALAERDLIVSFGQDVFGSHQELVERGGHADRKSVV